MTSASVPKTDFKSLISAIEANDLKAIEDEAARLARRAIAKSKRIAVAIRAAETTKAHTK